MAIWNQTGGWSSGSAYIEGTTSGRELLVFRGDNVSIPPLMGRINFDIVASGTIGVCGGVTNPTTETLWVEKVIINIATAASSTSSFLSLGVAAAAATAASSASNIADATVGLSTAGIVVLNSSALLPEIWSTGTYVTAYNALGSTVIIGDISVFYVSAVTT